MERLITALLIIVGLVNFLPIAGIASAEALAKAYGIAAPEGDLLILMRHRALLFGILGGLILVSAFRRHLQPAAMVAGFLSMVGFIALALLAGEYGDALRKIFVIDVVATLLLIVAATLRLRIL